MDTQSFNCTNCGAPLDYDGSGAATVTCPYCKTSVIVPKELRGTQRKQSAPAAPAPQLSFIVIGIAAVFLVAVTGFWLVAQLGRPSNTAIIPTTVARVASTNAPTPTALFKPSPTPGFASPVMIFGSKGIGPGLFNNSTNIAVDGLGNLYVGDRQGGRVQIFDANGKFISQWVVGDSKTIIYSFAADRKGALYMARDGVIEQYEGATGKLTTTYVYTSGKGFESIALMPDGGLAALWYQEHPGIITSREGVDDNLVQFDALGKVTRVITDVVSNQTDSPERNARLAVDGTGNIFIASPYSFAVFKYSREGKFITRFGSRTNASAPDQFELGTMAIAIDNQGRVLVMNNGRVLMFNAEGRYLDTIKVAGSAYAITINDKNEFWLAQSDQVSKFVLNTR